jgi:hypothetical protein
MFFLCVALYVLKPTFTYKNFALIFWFDNFLVWDLKSGREPKFRLKISKIGKVSKEKLKKCQVARSPLLL